MKQARDFEASLYSDIVSLDVFSAEQLTVDEAFGQTMSFIDDVKTAEKHLRSMYVRLARKMVACERNLRPKDRRDYLALCEGAVPSSTSLNRAINSERRLFAMKDNGNNDALLVREILRMHDERPSRLDECSARLLGEDGTIRDVDLARRYLDRSINAAGLRPSEEDGGQRLRVPKQYRKDVAHVRFEEWAGDLLKKIYPDFRWRHEGRFHKSERGLDWLGTSDIETIGAQIKYHMDERIVDDIEWTKFLAGCFLKRVHRAIFITSGRLSSTQRSDAASANVQVFETLGEINRHAERMGIVPWQRG